ncbi:C-x8-C-x5-C-x3-H type zinc finger protein-like protein [Eremomyces bilateralis CBS 781.70]|uniref:C-x8-C-x5-C-x3-H type zinc finger protein-like protein n=1 Tax=Eremomyces bilateralis CBS 781.70 TaxID=1392243 RepID=A0A6G1FQ81_9PEZI|nr:C-x8-C-x5-C-x3-H type zinc finger protein-like protein [Eremomyces bilateralis CBS 781.70]KAF1807888.1 C-x8-C-x5-C-x3-H type zinc finger protein-like protein [Eremomyces bilateralis CBS 781.70]
MVSVESFREQFNRLKEVEGGKDQLIEDLISRVEKIQHSFTEKEWHLEREQETTKLYQTKHYDVQVKLKKTEEEIGSNGFVSVLIDGDCVPFVDHFVESAQQGGKEAACHLRNKVCEYASTELDLPSNIQIRVRVYANTKGLASAYCYNKILGSADGLQMFVRGFNMGHPMCDFVDAGDGKECADSKLKAWFEHDMADVQCQAVIFGGSADDGYARLLQPYIGGNSKSKRIVLVEGPPFAKELAVLKDKFLIVHFPDVFRGTKLPSRRVSFSTTPSPTPISRAPSYATTIASPVDATAVTIDKSRHSSTTIIVPARMDYPILQNSKGQRLDEILNPPQSLVQAQRNKKLCNAYHILGECPYPKCTKTYVHGSRLDEKGLEARRLIARQSPCRSGLQCRDAKCILGHECPDKACIGTRCRFPRETHDVDRT